jgi:hypothetical protein
MPVTTPNTTCVAVGSGVFVGAISVAVGGLSVAMGTLVAGADVGSGAPQAVRIIAMAIVNKVTRNILRDIFFFLFLISVETKVEQLCLFVLPAI